MYLKNCNIYQLKKIVNYKRLICFGMGRVLRDFLEDFSSFEIEKHIYAIVDNKINEKDKFYLINNKSIPLISINELLSIENIVILISCADIDGVYKQLNQYELLKNVEGYAVYFIRSQTNKVENKNRRYPDSFKRTKEQKIPKKIHYCWFGRNEMPEQNKKWIQSWSHYCPEYEIVRWDESNYDVTKNDYMYEAYKNKKWGFVSDYARLDIIYSYGGIYLDTDVELIKCLDELLYQSAFCGVETSRKINLGLGLGARKGHPEIRGIMDLYKDIHFLDTKENNNLVTCVQLQHPYFKKKGFVNSGDYQLLQDLVVLPEDVLSPKDLYTGELTITEHTFSIHHFDGSWVDAKKKEKVENMRVLYREII